MKSLGILTSPSLLLPLLSLVSEVCAHGHEDSNMTTGRLGGGDLMNMTTQSNSTIAVGQPSYFRHPEHSYILFGHILLMSLSWVVVLPISVMLSIARSRFRVLSQLVFHVLNTIGVLLVMVYNSNTPDLYVNNAHHKIGWIFTLALIIQTFLSSISSYINARKETGQVDEQIAFMAISAEAMSEHDCLHGQEFEHRFSDDSGQGTERNTQSLRSESRSPGGAEHEPLNFNLRPDFNASDTNIEKQTLLRSTKLESLLSKVISCLSSRTLRVLQFVEGTINRLSLIMAFIALATGIVTYGGIFRGRLVLSGLAHVIKGAVFFWFGVLALARWAGCFGDIGWAWNINPAIVGGHTSYAASAEFMESFLIFVYGITNIFMEHLGSLDGIWTAQDLEHVAITILFLGGGLCGMLIDSQKVRDLLNTTPNTPPGAHEEEVATLQPPKSYIFPMNPLPALIILLLGMIMSSHHQESMVSTMIHAQWGTLLMGAALARGATYVLFFLSPPTSFLPSRPPTELITAFCLMSGGFLFMASSKDTVAAMEYNDINAMFVFTVTIGLILTLMAWIIVVIAVKGWAVRSEGRAFLARDGRL